MTAAPNILLLGGTGQIGRELLRELSRFAVVAAPTRADLDLASPANVRRYIRELRPAIVVNAAGYTMVDRAESELASSARLNTDLPALLAEECRGLEATFVHFSTDYVFDGTKAAPYVETDEPRPLGIYGRTKRDGELAVIAAGGAFFIVRTAWVYAAHGSNFPATIMRLARERADVAVVNDQIGAPTSAPAVAAGVRDILRALARESDPRTAAQAAAGVYHMTAAGATTWHEFAQHVLADDARVADHICEAVRPIATAKYPTAARRPAYSVLDNAKLADRFGIRLAPWLDQWRAVAVQLRRDARQAYARETEARAVDHLRV